MTRQLARRTMKARRSSICRACGGPVIIGQRIGLTGLGWVHITCILQPPAQATPTEQEQA